MRSAELTEQTIRQEQGEPAAKTFRVLGMNKRTWKEKVVAEGLTQQEAEAIAERMRRDVLCHGFCVWTEEERGR